MNKYKRIISIGITLSMLSPFVPLAIAADYHKVAYENFDYGEMGDISAISGLLQEDSERGFGGGITTSDDKGMYAGQHAIYYDDELEMNAMKAQKEVPSGVKRTLMEPIDIKTGGDVYLIHWKQKIGADDNLRYTFGMNASQNGQGVAFNSVKGGFKQESADSPAIPYVEWGTNQGLGQRPYHKGKWYNMYLKLETSADDYDVLSLKAYPVGETAQSDYDATVRVKGNTALPSVAYISSLLTGGSNAQSFTDLKIEKLNKSEVTQAEELVDEAINSVVLNSENEDEKIAMAEEATAGFSDSILRSMLSDEIQTVIIYKNIYEMFYSLENSFDSLVASQLKSELDNMDNVLIKEDFLQRYDKLSALGNAIMAVQRAEESKSTADADAARTIVEAMEESEQKAELLDRLLNVECYIKAIAAIAVAENTKNASDLDLAQGIVDSLRDGDDKDELNLRLSALRAEIANETATEYVIRAEETLKTSDILLALEWIDALTNEDKKASLTQRINEAQRKNNEIVPTINSISIEGTTQIGSTLLASLDITDELENSGDFVYKWLRGTTADSGQEVGSSRDYVISSIDADKYITLRVTPTNSFGKLGEMKSFSIYVKKQIKIVEDNFDFPNGTLLSSCTELAKPNKANGFSTGYTKNSDLSENMSGDIVVNERMINYPVSTSLYRGLSNTLDMSSSNLYYFKWLQTLPKGAEMVKNRSLKLELASNGNVVMNFGFFNNGTDYISFIKDSQNIAYGNSEVTFERDKAYEVVGIMKGLGGGKRQTSLYIGGAGPLAAITSSIGASIDRIGFVSNITSAVGHSMGPITIECYDSAEQTRIDEAKSAITAAKSAFTEDSVKVAEDKLLNVSEGIPKSIMEAELSELKKALNTELQNIENATKAIEALENESILDIADYNERLDAALEICKLIINEQTAEGLNDRIEALKNKLYIYEISALRCFEDFSYDSGTALGAGQIKDNFLSHWMNGSDLNAPSSMIIDQSGVLESKGDNKIFAKMNEAINSTGDKTEFIQWEFKLSALDDFVGISLGDSSFGASLQNGAVVPTAVTSKGTTYGNSSLEYNALYKGILILNDGKCYFWIAPSDGEWNPKDSVITEDANIVTDALGFTFLGAKTQASLFGIIRESARKTCISDCVLAVNAADESKSYEDILNAEEKLLGFTDCILNRVLNAQIDVLNVENSRLSPIVDYVSIDGTPKAGNTLTATYKINDQYKNYKEVLIKWSGSKTVTDNINYSVGTSDASRKIYVYVTPINRYGVLGETVSTYITIQSGDTSGGGGSGGGGGSNGFSPPTVQQQTNALSESVEKPEEEPVFADKGSLGMR